MTPACPRCGALRPDDAPGACLGCVLGAPPVPAILGDSLELGDEVLEDDLGVVYAARDARLGEVRVRFVPAAPDVATDAALQALAALRHPHLAAVHGFGREADEVYIVSEPARGRPFGLDRPAALLSAALQALDALAHAHARGLAHGALTPDRVRVGPRGRVKVLDLGVAPLAGRPATPTGDVAALARLLLPLAALHPPVATALERATAADDLRRELAEARVRLLAPR